MGIVQHFRSLGDDSHDTDNSYEHDRAAFILQWIRMNPDKNINDYKLKSYTRYGYNHFTMKEMMDD